MARELASQMGAVVHEVNLTIPNKIAFSQGLVQRMLWYSALLSTTADYTSVLWNVLQDSKGAQTPCIVSVTYGNRHYDDALLEMYDLVKENGFLPFAAAALVAQHTFGDIQRGRPNEKDLKENREFAVRATKTIKGKRVFLKKYRETNLTKKGRRRLFCSANKGKLHWLRFVCRKCPQQAICAADGYSIDPTRCISCFACIKYCPVNAKCMETPEYLAFAKKVFRTTCSETRE